MIAIINRENLGGDLRRYTVGINEQVVATFEHNRSDGLATCLRKAANAVEMAEPKPSNLFPRPQGRWEIAP